MAPTPPEVPSDPPPGRTADETPTGQRAETEPPDPADPEPARSATDDAEELEELLDEGNQPIRPGTLRSVLSYRDFRVAFAGAAVSNIGTWMQNVVVLAYAYDLTGSAAFVGLMGFAHLAPHLFFALVGGTLADTFDRRWVIAGCGLWQLVLVFVLAGVATSDDPSRALLVVLVFAIGSGSSMQAPTFSALLPTLVPHREIQGAISLTSANLNLSRVVGPALGGILYATLGVSWVFAINGFTYVFLIAGVLAVPARTRPGAGGEHVHPLRRVLLGVSTVWRDPLLRRCIASISFYSLFCLTFITQFPVLAAENFGIDTDSAAYGLLYATFAAGSLLGALSVGFLYAGRPLHQVARWSLVAFSVALLTYGAVRTPGLAYLVAFVLGIAYFSVITSIMTVLQRRVADAVRGRVVAVWMMALGGTLPLGGLVGGWLVDATHPTVICVIGAVASLVLAWFTDLREPEPRTGAATAPAP